MIASPVTLFLSLLLVVDTRGFAPSRAGSHHRQRSSRSDSSASSLLASSISSPDPGGKNGGIWSIAPDAAAELEWQKRHKFLNHGGDELTYRYLLAKARECAYTDDDGTSTALSAEARMYLDGILEIESGCASGVLHGRDLCGTDAADVAEVVALLREKAAGSKSSLAAPGSGTASLAAAVVPVSLLALLVAMMVVSTTHEWNNGKVPYTFEEWVWGTKGGSLPTMIDHYTRNGWGV